MRAVLALLLLSFGIAAHANEVQESYTPRVDKLEVALRTRGCHAIATLSSNVLAQLKAGQPFMLAKTDERVADESTRSYNIVFGSDREEISPAAYEALRSDFALRQR